MPTTTLNIRVEANLKKEADALFSELGLTMSSAMNIFLKESVRYGGIPFELRIEQPNARTKSSMGDIEKRRNLSDSHSTVESLMDDLNA